PAFADDKPKPNRLTPKEIADGWILLFDGETSFGWKVEGEAKVQDGKLIIGGDKATSAKCRIGLRLYELTVTASFEGKEETITFENVGAQILDGVKRKPSFKIPLSVTESLGDSVVL